MEKTSVIPAGRMLQIVLLLGPFMEPEGIVKGETPAVRSVAF